MALVALPALAGLFEAATATIAGITLESSLAAIGLSTSFFTLEAMGAAVANLATRGLAFLTPRALLGFSASTAATSAVEALVTNESIAFGSLGATAIASDLALNSARNAISGITGLVSASVVEAGEIALGGATVAEIGSAIASSVGGASGEIAGGIIGGELGTTGAIISEGIVGGVAAGVTAGTVEALAAAGISEGIVGSVTWEYILKQIAIGAGVEVVVKSLTEDPIGFFNSVVNSIIEENGDGSGYVGELLFIDPNGYITNPLTSDFKYVDPYEMGYNAGIISCDAAMANFERHGKPFQQSDIEVIISMLEATTKNPQASEISKRLTAYYLSPEFQDPERAQKALSLYNQVYAVYDGKYQSKPFFDKNGNVAIYDEVGELQVYDGERGIWNIAGYEIKTPTLYGNFTGPLSPNHDLPIYSENYYDFDNPNQNIMYDFGLDLASLNHDVGFDTNGFFDFFSDLQLVSRLEHQFIRYREQKLEADPLVYAKASFTHTWFKYVSPWLSKLVSQDLGRNSAYEFLQSDEGDFYTYMLQQYRSPVNEKAQYGFNSATFRAQRLLRNEGRIHFYSGLTKAFNDRYDYYKQKYTSPEILKSIKLYQL